MSELTRFERLALQIEAGTGMSREDAVEALWAVCRLTREIVAEQVYARPYRRLYEPQ